MEMKSAVSLVQEIPFERIICPGSMRSSYWKFFGFPAGADGSIITRSKIICSICKAALCYNKNTSNLRSHLKSKHATFIENQLLTGKRTKFIYIGDSPTKTTTTTKDNNSLKDSELLPKIKCETITDDSECLYDILSEEIVEEDSKYTVATVVERSDFADVEYLSTISADEPQQEQQQQQQQYKVDDICNAMEMTSASYIISSKDNFIDFDILKPICKMVSGCLLSPDIVDEQNFQDFIKTINSNVCLPTSEMVKTYIQDEYRIQSTDSKTELIKLVQNKVFCVGFESWTNAQQRSYITVTLTYVENNNLKLHVLGTVNGDYSDWSNYFQYFNMDTCSAVISNIHIHEESALHRFLITNNIPIVPCFMTLVSTTLQKCFQLPTVCDALKKSMNFVNESTDLLTSNIKVPEIDERFWQTKYECLEVFTNVYANVFEIVDADVHSVYADIKIIIECIKPLKLTIDTILSEQVALCSLLKPLMQQLIDTNFTLTENDLHLEIELKSIIQDELVKSITGNNFLAVASFLDPRLQTYINDSNEIEYIKNRMKIVCECKEEPNADNLLIVPSKKKSGLDFFFGNKEQKSRMQRIKNPFEREFNQYRDEVNESFDQNPLTWWSSYGDLYPYLKKAADMVNCVPAMLPNGHYSSTIEQIKYQCRRDSLSHDMIEPLLWFHMNQMSYDFDDHFIVS